MPYGYCHLWQWERGKYLCVEKFMCVFAKPTGLGNAIWALSLVAVGTISPAPKWGQFIFYVCLIAKPTALGNALWALSLVAVGTISPAPKWGQFIFYVCLIAKPTALGNALWALSLVAVGKPLVSHVPLSNRVKFVYSHTHSPWQCPMGIVTCGSGGPTFLPTHRKGTHKTRGLG